LIGFFVFNSAKIRRFYKTEESWDMPYLVLNIAIFFEALSVLLQWLHLWQYSYNGVGSFVLDLLS